MFIGYFVMGLCALGYSGVQARLSVIFEDISINVMDPKYFNPNDAVANIDDDDVFSVRFTIAKTIPVRSQGRFTLFGLSMGEYVVPTGLDVVMSLCEMIVEPIIMGPIFTKLGFRPDSCPVRPGTFKMDRYKLPVENLPDEFEENKYKGTFEMTVDDIVIMEVTVITDVSNVFDEYDS